MTTQKTISQLTELTAAGTTDELAVVDNSGQSGVTKRITVDNAFKSVPAGQVSAPGLAFAADVDTGIARIGADQLALCTGGQARLTVGSTGNITIGSNLIVDGTTTSISSETLVVEDRNIELGTVASPSDTTANGGGITLKGATDKTIQWVQSTGAWTFNQPTNFNDHVLIDSSGNVGIGTTSPSYLLHARGATNPIIAVEDSTNNCQTILRALDSTGYVGTQSNHPLYLITGGSFALSVDTSQNVGIGTTSPSAKLHATGEIRYGSNTTYYGTIDHDAASTGANIYNSVDSGGHIFKRNNTIEQMRIDGSGDVEVMQGKNLTWVFAGGSTHRARIRAESTDALIFENGSGDTERMRIDSSGKVGIGASAPANVLEVAGNNSAGNGIGNVQGILRINNNTTAFGSSPTAGIVFATKYRTSPDIPLDGAAIYGGKENTSDANKSFFLAFATRAESGNNGNEAMRIDSQGRVGIGNTAPGAKLQIEGTSDQLKLTYTSIASYIHEVHSNGDYSIAKDSSERMRIDSSGTLLVGGTSAADDNHANINANGTLTIRRASSGDDCIVIKEGSTSSLLIEASGNVFNYNVGSFAYTSYDNEAGVAGPYASLGSFGGEARISAGSTGSDDVPLVFRTASSGTLNERVRIDGAGKLLVGTSSNTDDYNFQVDSASFRTAQFTRYGSDGAEVVIGSSRGTQGSKTALNNNDFGGLLSFKGYDGSNFQTLAWVGAQCDGQAPASGDSPGRLVFSTTADAASTPTERMRIDTNGGLYIGPSGDYSASNYGQTSGNGNFYYRRDTGSQAGSIIAANNADRGWSLAYMNKFAWNSGDDDRWINFYLNGVSQDSITWTGSAINYGTSSDYRRKTNPSTYTGAFEKVKQLHVREYDWIEFPEAGRTVGFFAHELQEIFPQAVTGVKDGMKIDEFTGEEVPDYQGIDYGKITPLLAAALQEAIAKIETLEQRLSDAGIA